MLKDMKYLLDRDEDAVESELKQTAQRLLSLQFFVRAKRGHRQHYDRLLRHQSYFADLMDALNYRLAVNDTHGFAGIIPVEFVTRMKLEESLVLMVLRYIYDEEMHAFHVEDDQSVLISLEELEDRYQQIAQRELPKSQVTMQEYLKNFSDHGLLEVDSAPEGTLVRVLPTISVLLDASTIEMIGGHMLANDIPVSTEDPIEDELA